MDSTAEHGASAARPPQAAPLPEAKCNNPNTPPQDQQQAATPVTTPPTAIASTISPIAPKSSSTSTSMTKKRPLSTSMGTQTNAVTTNKVVLASLSRIHNQDGKPVVLVPPSLKTKFQTKAIPAKAKKTLKKKKKKFSSILSGMMKPKKALDITKERESLRKNLGGGNFLKVDKI